MCFCGWEDLTMEKYKKILIEQIKEIQSEKLLQFLCELVQSFKENWGY